MAVAHVHVEESTVNLVPSEVKSYDLKCNSCLHFKEDLQASVNEIKSMAEIIKILKNDLGYDSASKGVSVLDNVQEDKGQIVSQRCCNCDQLENQLKVTLNELTSVKLIVEFLKHEIEFLKQKSPTDSSVDTSWLSAKSINSCGPTTLQSYKDNLSAKRSPTANRYAIPVANQYSALEKHYEPYEFNNKTYLSHSLPESCRRVRMCAPLRLPLETKTQQTFIA